MPVQLSVDPLSKDAALTVTEPKASKKTVISCPTTVGAVPSITSMLAEQEAIVGPPPISRSPIVTKKIIGGPVRPRASAQVGAAVIRKNSLPGSGVLPVAAAKIAASSGATGATPEGIKYCPVPSVKQLSCALACHKLVVASIVNKIRVIFFIR